MKEQKVQAGKDPKAMKDIKDKEREKERQQQKGGPNPTKPMSQGPTKR
jgi:hypothetical protein